MAATITDRLFTTRIASGRLLYKLYFIAFIAGIFSLCYYRLTHIPSDHPILWLLVSLAEFWFAATWVFQQGFRWAPTFHVTYPDRLPSNLPPVDLFVCTADPDREPPMLVADTLLSLMAYDYDANKLAFYLSDDGGSELTFHAIYQASLFAKHWLPFCRKYKVEPPAPQAYFSAENMDVGGGCQSFRRDYDLVKAKFEEMQNRIKIVGKSKKVPEVTRRGHKGFREWDSEINPRDHQTILVVLLQGNGKDVDVEGKPMPTLVYVSREKRSGHPHHYKAGALNALIEFFGTNAHNGPMYAGTGSVHRRESLNGRKFDPNFPIKLEDKSVKGSKNWTELEEKAKELIRCDYEMGKPWGKEMGVMYGCAVEDVFSGLVFHSRGWQSVFCSPERKAYLGLAPVNTNDTLIQHKRWSTGSLEIFLSDYCPWTHGVGRLKLGQIMCYSFYTLWALWCLPMLCYALIPPLAMANGISLFPQVTDPWFKVFASLGIASHIFSLGELMWAKGTIKMWWNETRMWMMKGSSSYLFSVIVIILKSVGISETGFEITSKVINQEALKRYNQEIMEFAVPSPMFIPTTTLSLLNLYCLLQTTPKILEVGLGGLDHLALQLIISGYISIISMPLYEALFLRKDKGRMPTSVTTYSITLAFLVFYLSSFVM
ncbi:PREDICTED: cellulose synthase-like protein E6 isoform X3 [Nelumbo nucifera]|uniref:Cellulose synthase-like protein E6 isoform X3 n=1 Tax=Nelumbo nucifera TaxID=4432 RepID=A0A1U8BCV6_NELNU|nr:PREDICTED: cellulose synthase-like protein E6 isoform X3 [Nelumbo nucifera]